MRVYALLSALLSFASISHASHAHGHQALHDRNADPYSNQAFTPNVPSLRSRGLPTGMCDKDTPCENKACCGADGRCGYSPDQCGKGCTSNCDAKAECGPYAPLEKQKCPLNVCCSEFGFCGSTDDFCKGKGCDTKYGGCGDPNRPSCKGGDSVSKRTIGYYESWSSTRKCQAVQPEELNLSGFTHINFAFSFFDPKSFQIAPMDSNSGSLYNRFTGLKAKAHSLETWISVGGWSFTDPGPTRTAFSDMASNPGNRKKFIDGLMQFMNTYQFDGVDLDWEYPVADDRGGKADDKANYVQLAKEMKAAFNGKYGISMTLPTSYWYLTGFDLVGVQESVDWFNLMAYDLHGVWDAESKFVGPYIAPHTNDTEIDLGLDLLWRAGVTPDKVVMGEGWYGRSFTLKDPSCNKPNGQCEFSGPAKPGPCSNAGGILDMQEINDIMKKNNIKPEYDEKANVKWFTWDNDQWVSFDDDQTFKAKKDFANGRCLGGLMVWAMDQVDQSASNGLGSAPNITPEQKKSVDTMGSNLDAGATCYTSKCSEKCKKNYHEVAQMTGQPGDLSTMPRCGKDKKGHQEHESLCCPKATTMGQCQWRGWRGVGLSCNSGCADGETEVAKNTNHITEKEDQSCAGGLQSYCCKGFAPPPPPKKKESIGEKIKHGFQDLGHDIKKGFDKAGEEIKNFAEGALLDVASKLVCRVLVPGVMGVAEIAEDAVPVAGEIADAGEIAAEPGIIAGCQKGIDKAVGAVKGKIKPKAPKEPVAPRAPPKQHDPPPKSGEPSKTNPRPTEEKPTQTAPPKSDGPSASKKTSEPASATTSDPACKMERAPIQRIGQGKNTIRSKECSQGQTTTHDYIITSVTYAPNAKSTIVSGTCAGAYSQACYHYSSAIRENPQWSTITCPPQAATTAYRQAAVKATSSWSSQHSGNGWQDKQYRQEQNCERDEYPPAYLLGPNDVEVTEGGKTQKGQVVRWIPQKDNGGAGSSGDLWKGACFKGAIEPIDDTEIERLVKQKAGVPKRNGNTNQYYVDITGPFHPSFSITNWQHHAVYPNTRDDGLSENTCWPQKIAPKDPGFTLLTFDKYYNGADPPYDYKKDYQSGVNDVKRDLKFDGLEVLVQRNATEAPEVAVAEPSAGLPDVVGEKF